MKTLALIIALSFVTFATNAQHKKSGEKSLYDLMVKQQSTGDKIMDFATIAYQEPSAEQKQIDLMIKRRKTGNKIIAAGLAVTSMGLLITYFASQNDKNGIKNAGMAIAGGGSIVIFTGIFKK